MSTQPVAEPKCPSCSIQGVQHIVNADSAEKSRGGDPWFNIVHCSNCGHVYGVFAKVTHDPSLRVRGPLV